MNAIPLILTAVVTISTLVYTFYSIQLWRASRVAAEISRQAAFSNLWAELNRYLEILREQKLAFTPTNRARAASAVARQYPELAPPVYGSGKVPR